MNAIVTMLVNDTELGAYILGMSFEDAYETVFSKASDILFEKSSMSDIDKTHFAQDAAEQYLKEIDFDRLNDPEIIEKVKQVASSDAVKSRHGRIDQIYSIVSEYPDKDTYTLRNIVKAKCDPEEKNTILADYADKIANGPIGKSRNLSVNQVLTTLKRYGGTFKDINQASSYVKAKCDPTVFGKFKKDTGSHDISSYLDGPIIESKEPLLVKRFFEAIGDLPAGYTEDEAADLFEMHANDPEIEIDDSDEYVTDDQKARMAQFIAVHGAPNYNGHQWFITLHGEDAENFGDDDFEEAADLGIKIDYSYDTITLTFPCCGYDDVYPDKSPSSPYEGRSDDYEEIM